ncbi:MAG: phage tail tube protein [Phycisphaerales bacterium]|jgi:hypothetical protein
MPQITGVVKIYVNGSLQRSIEGAELDLGGYEREAVVGHSVYGHKERVMPSVLTWSEAHASDTVLADLKDITGATLRYECDSGRVYLVTNAFVSKTLKLSGGDGEVEVEMTGDPAREETRNDE